MLFTEVIGAIEEMGDGIETAIEQVIGEVTGEVIGEACEAVQIRQIGVGTGQQMEITKMLPVIRSPWAASA